MYTLVWYLMWNILLATMAMMQSYMVYKWQQTSLNLKNFERLLRKFWMIKWFLHAMVDTKNSYSNGKIDPYQVVVWWTQVKP